MGGFEKWVHKIVFERYNEYHYNTSGGTDMTTFLTSSPTKEITPNCPAPALYERNEFIAQLAAVWPEEARCLMIAAFPQEYDRNDEMTWFYGEAVKNAGLPVGCFDLWDGRSEGLSREALHSYHAIFLAGGHVPTEMEWFESIGLRELLEGYAGIVVGTSAGTMNAAREVYAWPELPGESEDPNYVLFFPGLGLAETMVLPHYQKARYTILDGKKLVDEIACGHSYGKRYFAIPDGSYVLVKDGRETMFGESYLITEGTISRFCEDGQSRDCSM